LIATLLLALAASADEAPSETTETDQPVESPTDDAGEVQESSAETEEPVEIEPIQGLDIEEIVIIGEASGSTLKDETISVLSFDAELLSLEGIHDIRDLSNFTPSLEIKSAFAASNPTIYIRGVGLDDFNANAASSVSIYQDGVYMQSPAGQLFQFFDVERVEVLRGPQPTLYRNAEAGAILVNSRKPTDEYEAYLESTYGNFNAVEVQGAAGGPIIGDALLGRVSANWGIRDGTTLNRCARRPSPPLRPDETSCVLSARSSDGTLKFQNGMNDHANNIDAWAIRGQLLLRLPLGATESEWLLNAHGGQNKGRAFQYQHRGVKFESPFSQKVRCVGCTDSNGYKDSDGDFFAGDYNLDGPEDINLFGTNLKGSWEFGDGYELYSLTAYEWHDLFRIANEDANATYLLETEYEDTAWQFSEQLELRGEWNSLLEFFGLAAPEIGEGEWTVGGYWLQEDLDVNNFYNSGGTAGVSHLTQTYTQETRNFAAYAYSEYRLRPGCSLIPCDFTLLGGVRYNWEHKDFDTFVCEQTTEICDTLALAAQDDETWEGVGGEISLAWNFSDASSLYFKYSHGWKGGHFNGGATSFFDIITGVDPETVDSLEGGLRSFWFDGRLMLNVTGFYYDYRDLQVFILEQTPPPGGFPIPKLVNATEATVYGGELDLRAEPVEGLNLTYNFAWVESEYADFSVEFTEKIRLERPCPTCPRPPPVLAKRTYDYTGNDLIASPRLSMTGSIGYDVPLPGTLFNQGLGTLTPYFSFVWKDDIYFDACEGTGVRCNFPDKGTFGQTAFWLFNAALTWTSESERFALSGWVHNFLDEHYKTQNFDLSQGLGVILDAYADPRTYGMTFTMSF
jgi:iron complex outermembrane receptor protein